MKCEWSLVPLSELIEFTRDGEWGAEVASDGSIEMLVVRGTDFADLRVGELTGIPRRFIRRDISERKLLKPDDVLIETAGGTRDESTGRTALIKKRHLESAGLPMTCASFSRFIRFRREVVDPHFMYWWLQNLHVAGEMEVHQVQHTGVARFQFTRFVESMHAPVPPLPDQRAVAHILGTLDDKIELNHRMNETLEAMARAIFESWFVHFDPVRAKAEGRQPARMATELASLFPPAFVESELGEIPKGWTTRILGEVCGRVAMGPFGSDIKTDNFVEQGVPVIRGGNLTDGFVDERFVFLTDEKADELRNANAFPGDIVITHRGTLGQVGLIPKQAAFPRYVVSQSQMLLSANTNVVTSRFLFEYLRSPAGQHELLANTSQTGVPAIARPTSSVKAIRIVLPSFSVLQAHERMVDPMIEQIIANQCQSRTLIAMRDALLPRLLSGEIRVKDARKTLEGAL